MKGIQAMICEKFIRKEELKLKTRCRIYPDISDRDFWEKAKEDHVEILEEYLQHFEKEAGKHLTASLYREFATNGNRTHYEDIYFSRRKTLIIKVLLECFYNDRRYIDDILDLTWMILEETTWTLPAHNREVETADSLSDYKEHSLDLFLAETACTMAFVYQTVGEEIDKLSSVVGRRIKDRIETDVIDNYLKRNDYWWMGFGEKIPNNWNPWINSNVLAVSMMLEEDEEKLRDVVYKVMTTLDKYWAEYPFDGACDEGPSYWNQAGVSMLECLWLLKIVTDGQADFFKEEKVINTLEYFMKVYTGKGQFVNFADSGVNVSIFYATLYKFGKITDNKNVLTFAKHVYDIIDVKKIYSESTKSIRMLDLMTYVSELKALKTDDFEAEPDYYFPSTQVMTSKSGANPEKGLYIAAKGGHNAESHNHNDIGQFVIYKNGTKFIVDSGNMAYSRITFSDQRYTLFTTRSAYHNVPMIGGKEQLAGREYCAKNVVHQNNAENVLFSLDIKEAYENRENIEKWVRTIEFNRNVQEIAVTEDFAFDSEYEYALNFMTPHKAQRFDGGILLKADNGETLSLNFEKDVFEFFVEEIKIEDALLLKNWGEVLYRVTLKAKAKNDVIKYIIR